MEALEEHIRSMPVPANLSGALMGDGLRLIAETKKASPSKGLLRDDYNPADLAQCYVENGAAAVSVLTEVDHFQGCLEQHVRRKRSRGAAGRACASARTSSFDPYQVYEAQGPTAQTPCF